MSAKSFRFCLILILFFASSEIFAEKKTILPIINWLTKTGTPVFFVQEKELPMVDVQVVFDAGSARDQAKPGIAKITNDALSSGTTSKNANQIAATFDNVGARFSSAANRDMAVVAMRSLVDSQFLDPAFNSFCDILGHATFPESEFVRIKKQTLNVLDEQEELPASIAVKAFYNALYNGNPYGHPVSGTKESIGKFTANDLRSFYNSFYTSQNSMIAIVGDINESQARQMAERLSSQLNHGQKPSPLAFKPLLEKQLVQHISFPSSQTHVLIGQAGISRSDPAYFPVVVGNYILGGGLLTSRLFDEVREKRGLAYSVRSQFNALKEKGPFIIELQTRNKEAQNAITLVAKTVKDFINSGPSQQELDSAKKNITQGFILKLASNSAIMSQLITIGYYHLPLDYLDTYQKNVESVTNSQVKTTFQKIINPDNLITVTVGNNLTAQHVKPTHH